MKCGAFEEALLQWMELAGFGQALHRYHGRTVGLGREHQARAGDPAIEQYRASAAVAGAAAFLDTGEADIVSQGVEERFVPAG